MKWQIAKLVKEAAMPIVINEEVDFSSLIERHPDIRALSKIQISGEGMVKVSEKRVIFKLALSGTMTLGCALTLDDVAYPFEIQTTEVFTWNVDDYDEASDEHLATGNQVELAPIIWQHIFLEIPLKVVSDGAYEKLRAQGIEIESEEEFYAAKAAEKPTVDPRFEVLKKLNLDE